MWQGKGGRSMLGAFKAHLPLVNLELLRESKDDSPRRLLAHASVKVMLDLPGEGTE
jgi:hypothetical protein